MTKKQGYRYYNENINGLKKKYYISVYHREQ